MRRIASTSLVILSLFIASGVRAEDKIAWTKYSAKDGTFSFHYPTGWVIEAGDSAVQANDPGGLYQLVICAAPYAEKSPREIGEAMIQLLRKDNPDMTGSNWRSNEDQEDAVVLFRLAYTENKKPECGDAMVLKLTKSKAAMWISIAGPAKTYSREHAAAILQGVLSSYASGNGSKPPVDMPQKVAADPTTERMRANARGFVFLVEYALCTPLTAAQERTIAGELQAGWAGSTEKELAAFDAYPKAAEAVLKLGAKDADAYRAKMAPPIKAWLGKADANDPAVKALLDAQSAQGKVVAAGEPPLTETATAAVSELMVYSHLLHEKPDALPSEVSTDEVVAVHDRIIAAWPSLSAKQRQAIAECPLGWVVLRAVIRFGNADEPSKARDLVRSMASGPSGTASQTDTSGKSEKDLQQQITRNWATQNMLSTMKQQTFNTWQWAHGFDSFKVAP